MAVDNRWPFPCEVSLRMTILRHHICRLQLYKVGKLPSPLLDAIRLLYFKLLLILFALQCTFQYTASESWYWSRATVAHRSSTLKAPTFCMVQVYKATVNLCDNWLCPQWIVAAPCTCLMSVTVTPRTLISLAVTSTSDTSIDSSDAEDKYWLVAAAVNRSSCCITVTLTHVVSKCL